MGNCAELCVAKYKFTREEQDAFSLESYQRAQNATKSGEFADEIAPVEVPQKKGEPLRIDADEEPFSRAAREDADAQARVPEGRHGHGGELLEDQRRRRGPGRDVGGDGARRRAGSRSRGSSRTPAWRRRRSGSRPRPVGRDPEAPRRRRGLTVADIDLWEINEAFAAVAMAAIKELSLPPDKRQRPRRRRRPRASDRRVGRAHPRRRSSTPSASAARSAASRRSASAAAKPRRCWWRRPDGPFRGRVRPRSRRRSPLPGRSRRGPGVWLARYAAPSSRAAARRAPGSRPGRFRRRRRCADRSRAGRPRSLPAAGARSPARAVSRGPPGSGSRPAGLERVRVGGKRGPRLPSHT